MFWLLTIVAITLLFYYFLLKPQLYWRQRNVKQGPPIPIFGDNFRTFLNKETMFEMVKTIYNRHKDVRYVGMYQTTLPTLMIRDPDLIKQITVKDFDHFVDHRQFIPESIDSLWTRNLLSLKGDRWREMRATLSPTFTAIKMRAMFTLMEKSAQQYVNFYLDQKLPMIEIELKDSFTRFANDVIANCAFGITIDSLKDPNNTFYLNGKDITNFSGFARQLKFLLTLLVPKICEFFKITFVSSEMTQFFKNMIRDTISIREEQNIIRPDMINLLMEARKGRLQYVESEEVSEAGFTNVEESDIGKKGPGKQVEMNETDMAAQVMIFFFAGFETISTTMSFMFYELAVHPDIQDKLRNEIDRTYAQCKGNLTYDLLNQMIYMDMVISESMRKDPSGIALDRICTRDYTILPERPGESPVHLKPGDSIWLPTLALQHDEKYFPNPMKFDPERFSDENKSNIKPYTFMPFGVGPRNCIGSRFALMEIKTLTFHILSKFEVTVIGKTTIPMKLAKKLFIPAIEGGFWVGFKRRENPVIIC